MISRLAIVLNVVFLRKEPHIREWPNGSLPMFRWWWRCTEVGSWLGYVGSSNWIHPLICLTLTYNFTIIFSVSYSTRMSYQGRTKHSKLKTQRYAIRHYPHTIHDSSTTDNWAIHQEGGSGKVPRKAYPYISYASSVVQHSENLPVLIDHYSSGM